MKTRTCLATALIAFAAAVAAGEKLVVRELLDGKVSMLLPADFTPLPEKYRKLKYPGAHAPTVVMSDESTTVNVALDHKLERLETEHLKELEAEMRQRLKSARFNSAGLRKLSGREFLVMDFDTAARDGTIRNILAMTSLDHRLLGISYNCMVDRDPDCGKLGTRLIESIRVRN